MVPAPEVGERGDDGDRNQVEMTTMSNGRKVSTDALETLGTIIGDGEKRDAIHLAVVPMVAMETMSPGEACGPVPGGAAPYAVEKLGIVDPFLSAPIRKGERFWFFLRPRLVTSLRHVWSHPAFADEGASAAAPSPAEPSAADQAKWWIANWARSLGFTYDDAIYHATDYLDHDEYWSEGGRFEGERVPEEFWEHFQAATGRVVKNNPGSFFSCAC